MTAGDELLRLLEQSMWANRAWIDYVYSQAEPRSRPLELLSHIMLGERVWFERIDGEQTTQSFFHQLTKEDLLKGLEENRRTYERLIAGRLADDIRFRRGSGEEYHARVIDIVHHLLTHGYHHRGQLALHYARKGVKYPNTDHINWLYENRL